MVLGLNKQTKPAYSSHRLGMCHDVVDTSKLESDLLGGMYDGALLSDHLQDCWRHCLLCITVTQADFKCSPPCVTLQFERARGLKRVEKRNAVQVEIRRAHGEAVDHNEPVVVNAQKNLIRRIFFRGSLDLFVLVSFVDYVALRL
ncbi:hypothetical protein VNO80_26743 [Phaseolus coccineus]|uniref:Uncharacterized protein n=1 Tax=Phaseolus coccineus TaxID=3886 RepID=A0AAN9LIV5_PHACN